MLDVRLLSEQRVAGGPAVGGRPPSSRATAVLAYLVLHAGIPQTRQHLAGVFWPDSTEAQARTNLRRELHHLRLLLAGHASLVVEPAALTWRDTRSCRVDVRVFRTERSAALAALSAGDSAGFARHADAAIAEYRGELMPGSFDQWVLDQRDELRRECADLCDRAAAVWRGLGDRTRAVEIARRRVRLEPLEEVGYRRLMELQAESGDRAAAVSTYHRCATVLEQELGIGADPQTIRVAERLLLRHGGSVPDGASARAAGWSARSGVDEAGLVGRGGEVTLLAQRWGQALDGRSGLVVVSGQAGVGKTRLVAELADVAAGGGGIVATTRCFGASGRVALAPVAEWLRSRDLQPGVAALEPVWRGEVERLVPRRRGGGARRVGDGPGAPAPPAAAEGAEAGTGARARAPSAAGAHAMVDAWQRHRFFEGLARAVLAVAHPTLLVLDDLQWCDQETVAWLAFLLRFAADAPLLVAVTVRTDELDHNWEVSQSLRAWRSAGHVTDVALAPLDATGTAQLAGSLFGRALTAADEAVLYAATGGYPLFVVEASRSLPDPAGASTSPASTASTTAPAPLVADLDAVLRRRLEQLSPGAREVAGLAAAVGRDFSLDLLSEAGDLDADALVAAVDELWRRRILREQRGGYDFSHDLLRDAAYATVSPPRRWLLHRRLAQGLELLHKGDPDKVAAQLAEQYDRAGRPERAMRYYRRAAAAAAGVFANTEAIRLQRRCLDLVEQMPSGRDRDRYELDLAQAMSAPLNAVHGYSSPLVQATLERSAALAERLGRPQVLLNSLIGLWAVRFVQGQTTLAHALATRALALAETDPDLAPQAHFAFAGSATSLGMPAVAVTHFDLAEDGAPDAVSLLVGTRMRVHAKAFSAHAHWLLGDDERAAGRCVEAVERGRAAEHPYSLAVALAYAAITCQLRGDREALLAAAAELDGLCRRYEFAYYREWALILGGWASGGERGVARIRQGIGRLRSQGAYARMPYWLALLADMLIGCGRDEAARAVLDGASAAARQRDDRWWLPEVLRLRASLEPAGPAVDLLSRAADVAGRQLSWTLEARCRADLAALGVREPAAGASVPVRAANAGRTLPA